MKATYRTVARSLLTLSLFVLCAAVSAAGQNREAHVISASAGGVNFVSGESAVRRAGETGWQALGDKDSLAAGDTLRTGAGGRVELLLNPGSYLRLGENSELALADASLDNLRLKLLKGSAVVEATGFDDLRVSIAFETPQSAVSIIKSGIYRFNVLPSNVTEVAVHKGRALVGGGNPTKLRGDKVARVEGGNIEVAKFDKKNSSDDLDLWSRERGKMLAQANQKLSRQNVNALIASQRFPYFSAEFSRPFYGFWAYNSVSRCYTFLPFYDYWASPYGSWYSSRPAIQMIRDPRCLACRGLGISADQIIAERNYRNAQRDPYNSISQGGGQQPSPGGMPQAGSSPSANPINNTQPRVNSRPAREAAIRAARCPDCDQQ